MVNVYGKVYTSVGSNAANVGNANPDNGLNVNDWNRGNGNDNIRVVRLIVSGKKFRVSFAWWTLSSRQASYLFPVSKLEVLDIFYQLDSENLCLTLKVFLEDLIWC
ncbi:MAG: hypothetical protein ACD_30C00092G0003 [uncultured bacterium]|uniref:Uncharacterized protein n=1 Tax=Candidatus Daviesbacteria bacterium RIFCSPHIGHO2_12_FULL_37_16 TaxID=1797778 RepID=A0A1F5K340_9BACT|nr:MAG: hypothetical protein ACD_30C00092G0003 [uncultured bacterium]OGE35225.1 MAG: hypothetical protein A3E66_00010 [Candidatus Daviesbacteria bacterium RIFCSPHIGHO2_12_FULL_37_16]